MSEFTEVEHEAARLLSRPVEEASAWLQSITDAVESSRSQIESWAQMLLFEYGCWCGPGHRCEDPVDAMDSCCKTHDLAYDALRLDSVTMWGPAAMVATIEADEALVDCVSSSSTDGESDEAKTYRTLLLDVFKSRIDLAKSLKSMGL
jgi:hypothetical protein